MLKFISTGIFLCLTLAQVACQTTRNTAPVKSVKALDEAMKQSRNGQTEKALQEVDKLLKNQPDFVDAWLLKANLHTDLKEWSKVEAAYEEALKLKADYYPNTARLLAQAEWEQDKYIECAAHARQFLSTPSANSTQPQTVKDQTLRLAENAEFAAVAVQNPVPFQRERLNPTINTLDPEYLPSLTADGRFFLFTRRDQNRDENYYLAERTSAGWSAPLPVEALNTPNLEGAASLSADGQFMVFSSEGRANDEGAGSFDLWYTTTKGGGRYGPPQRFGNQVNTSSWDAQPCLSANGNELYFSSLRPGGKGGKDLWVARMTGGKFGEAVNLTALNTAGQEQVPYIHPDGQTLYFTSDGLPGMGNQDIYYSRRNVDGSWGKPINLGYPINTKEDEGSLFVAIDGVTAYYAAREMASGQNHDLYQFELPPAARPAPVTYVQGKVLDINTRKRLKSKLKIIDLESKASSDVFEGPDGFFVCLPAGKNYGFYAEKDGYLFSSQNYNFTEQNSMTKPQVIEILLTPIVAAAPIAGEPAKGSVIVLNNLLFDTGSSRLKNESEIEVAAVFNLLKAYPDLKIAIHGHTDNTGSAATNQSLSEARAKVLYDQLITRGIDAKRLIYKGLGSDMPVAPNDTEAGRAQNRRTELVIQNS
jgi:outer membrane protein OmpA-like peptidoglycan-associated protein